MNKGCNSDNKNVFYKKTFLGVIIPNERQSKIRVDKMGVCFSNSSDFLRFKAKDDVFYPPTKISLNWFVWICILDEKTCDYCKEFHKKIC